MTRSVGSFQLDQVRQVPPLRDDALRIGQEFQGYRVEAVLGRGGMGEVYLALEIFLDRYVALKVAPIRTQTDPLMQDRLRREAAAGVRIEHERVVRVLAGGMHEGKVYVAMEYLRGGITLRELMKTEQALDASDAVAYAIQIADALKAIHAIEIHHRDLKPENVLALPGGGIKVIDFGLARVRTEALKTTRPPQMGTPHYMAPERFDDTLGLVDGRVDIYALGIMLLEMLLGAHPFEVHRSERLNKQEVTMRHVIYVPPPLRELRPGLPDELSDVIVRMVEKRPSARPTADEVGRVLRSVVVDLERRRSELEQRREAHAERVRDALGPTEPAGPALLRGAPAPEAKTEPLAPPAVAAAAVTSRGTVKMSTAPAFQKAPPGKRGTARMPGTVGEALLSLEPRAAAAPPAAPSASAASSYRPNAARFAAAAQAELEGRAPPRAPVASSPAAFADAPAFDTDRAGSSSRDMNDDDHRAPRPATVARSALLGVVTALGIASVVLLAFVAGRVILGTDTGTSSPAPPSASPASSMPASASSAQSPAEQAAPPAAQQPSAQPVASSAISASPSAAAAKVPAPRPAAIPSSAFKPAQPATTSTAWQLPKDLDAPAAKPPSAPDQSKPYFQGVQ